MERISGRDRVHAVVRIYVGLFLAALFWVWVWFWLHRHGVHDFPLGERVERFGDLVRFTGKHQIGQDPRIIDSEHLFGTLFPKNYPALSVLIYLFLLQVCAPYAVLVMLGVFFGAVLVGCTLVWKRVRHAPGASPAMMAAIFLTGLLGWGTLQVAMRGNIEGWMWIAVSVGASLLARRRYAGAGAAFGVAMCLKPYPVLWLVLLALHRRYKEAALGIATYAGVTLLCLEAINRNPIAAYRSISGKSTFFQDYVVAFRPMPEMEGDFSLMESIKTLARVVRNHGLHFAKYEYGMHSNDPLAWKIYHAYLPLAAVIGLFSLWKVRKMPLLNQIFTLAAVTMVLPMVSGLYTLSLLMVPLGFFAIFLAEDVAGERTPLSLAQLLWITFPAVCLTATLPWGLLHAVFRCAAVLVLLGASLSIPMPSTLFGENAPAVAGPPLPAARLK